ncbi:MAG: hypothetical protein KAU46_03715 [Candidatus Aminicenantes bacterium]|nr:hypothetical protein [Candidatus Aminicenantes bacterium]
MKKFTAIGIVIIFALLSFISCEKKPAAPSSGAAQANDMLSLLPVDAQGVLFIDIQRIMAIDAVDEIIKEEENEESYQKYQEFIEKTGIDPKEDIYSIAASATKGEGKEIKTVSFVLNLKYSRETLLPLIKENMEEGEEFTEKEYDGFTIYTIKKEGEKEVNFAFLDDSNISAGNEEGVKSVIDVLQKKRENVFKNDSLAALLADANKGAILWGAFAIPPEVKEEMTGASPMLKDIEAINAASLSFDYKNKSFIAEIKLLTGDPDKSRQIADSLNGLKMMGSMIQIQDFNMGEVLDNIEITAGPDHVNIYASFPEELLDKLKEKEKK